VKKTIWLLLLFCLGCKSKPKPPVVHISLIDSNRSIKLTGLDYPIISEINRDSSQASWQSLLPVFRMPTDTDMKDYQPVQPGSYELKDSAVVFTPDTPFIKGQTYFVRYYQFGAGTEMWDYIKGKNKLGSVHYIDLPFK
jgi:hypothetical protein